jgi:hypothetical protein
VEANKRSRMMSANISDPLGDKDSVAPSQADTLVDRDDCVGLSTATGRPLPNHKPSALKSMAFNFVSQAPQLLPVKYTDDSIIPVPVLVAKTETDEEGAKAEYVSTFV